MSVKSIAAKLLAKRDVKRINEWASNPIQAQSITLSSLGANLSKTAYGSDIGVSKVPSVSDWSSAVPLVDYEVLRPYVERVKNGEHDILYPGLPQYLCTTSGTTSGAKYIPMTEHGIKAQILAARNSLLCYLNETKKTSFIDGKMIFLQGSPVMETVNGIGIGRLSGIVAHHVPSYLQRNRMPSWETNCMEDWESKIDAIVEETMHHDMRLISGIPPWVKMYFERLLEKTGKATIKDVFPNFSLFAHGGVNFEPYKGIFNSLIGAEIDSIETYPASEGFIAFQDSQKEEGLLLNLDAGIFYEFIPMEDIHSENPRRLTLANVEMGVNYAIVLNTSSGLWGYLIGDTVKFVSNKPFRIQVTGRIAHFISAFGEHVIAEEVENVMTDISAQFGLVVSEFHVAPEVNPSSGLPYHQWFIESEASLNQEVVAELDKAMCSTNKYYHDLIIGKVLRSLEVVIVPKGTFNRYMDSIGKLGGQNKLPRLSNDRIIADKLESYL
ncbi:GH3 auxin-responsive promoter family protein [bacterium]|nr:GH3 auxin-responsive promoter family protein [bacterium]